MEATERADEAVHALQVVRACVEQKKRLWSNGELLSSSDRFMNGWHQGCHDTRTSCANSLDTLLELIDSQLAELEGVEVG